MADLLNVLNVSALADDATSLKRSISGTMFKAGLAAQFGEPFSIAPRFIERRSKIRYPIELEVRFLTPSTGPGVYGIGRTVNISTSGLLISSACVVEEDTRIHVMVQWPWALDGRVPLQLVGGGVVVRSDSSTFAVAVDSYQLRTMKQKAPLQNIAIAGSST